jgi:hypothetical protein
MQVAASSWKTREGDIFLNLVERMYPKFPEDHVGDDPTMAYLRMTEAQEKQWGELCAHFEHDIHHIKKSIEERAQAKAKDEKVAGIGKA